MQKNTLRGFNFKTISISMIVTLCVTIVKAQDYQLVWSDEFENGISEDWVFEVGRGKNGWGNNELQYYRRENATVENGNLVITAKKENFDNAQYTSARLKTHGMKSWKYGKMEARIKLPAFKGSWPAFWMLGDKITTTSWPQCGEIDIMEQINTEAIAYGTVHFIDANQVYLHLGGNSKIDVNAFHTYAIEWTDKKIQWSIDGKVYHELNIENGINGTSEFHESFFLILNTAIGGKWPGYAINDAALPASMYVDYVRVYQQEKDIVTPSPTIVIEAENFSSKSGGIIVEDTSDEGGGKNLGAINTKNWVSYNKVLNVPEKTEYLIEYRVSSLDGGGRLSADLNGGDIILGALDIPKTGDWQTWTTISHTVTIEKGLYNFGVYAIKGGWNLNWIKITPVWTLDTDTVIADSDNQLMLFPNPTSDILNASEEILDAEVMDVHGKNILIKQVSKTKFDVSTLPSGVYFLTNKKKTFRKKFIKD